MGKCKAFLVILSTALSSPIAYYLMNVWLRTIEYHIDIQWWVFAIGAVGAITIAMVTISFQAIKGFLFYPIGASKKHGWTLHLNCLTFS